MNVRKLLIRLAVLALCVALGATMMVIGRGHTIYFDNKALEYNGTEYKAFQHVDITVKGAEKKIQLDARERGSAIWLGQNFHMELTITDKRGSMPRTVSKDLKLPYGVDGIIINLPALLSDLPQEAWFSEFIPAPEPETSEDPGVDIGDIFTGGTEVFE